METNPFLWEIVELAVQLREERLFVNSQQSYIQELNDKVAAKYSQLAQVSWITSQQRLNLNQLVLSSPNSTPSLCCQRARNLDFTNFIDAQKYLGFQKCGNYGELLSLLRDSPELVARCLVAGDKSLPEEMPKVIRSLISGLYGSCVLTAHKNIVLKILKNLITLQIIPSESPRRLLQQGSCAFARLYSAFHETLFAAKLYLTAALNNPIMGLLMMEEKYLDIEPEKKVAERFSLEERIKRFGLEGSEEYKTGIRKYKFSILKDLVKVTLSFINSLHENSHCFPNSVFWLVGQIHSSLMKANTIPEKEVFAMCTDLVFTLFICPAIVTPETYGITDVPISDVARYNLMQVAQILQMLAIRRFQPVDSRAEDLYSQFPKDCVSSIVVTMIEGNSNIDEPHQEENMKCEGLSRLVSLFTESELHTLVTFLRTLMNESACEDLKMHKELIPLLSQIPPQMVNGHSKTANIPLSENSRKSSILSKVGKNRGAIGSSHSLENGSLEEEDGNSIKVLIIPLDVCSDSSQAFVSEQKLLALEKETENDKNERRNESESHERQDGQEKRTRFSLSHDDGSIGNTSDNLDVVSEAPSNHSVASSLELETEDQNDNLSDMVSANVSGRGSPNISGRDTPSSQMTEGEDAASVRQPLDFTPPPPPKASTQTKFDINDKFGKFEIDKLIPEVPLLDETFSLVSDTWSTDVLASDSEIVEQLPQRPLQPVLHEITANNTLLGDALETASEAWSTDVVISDSDRLTEVDTDDTASVARSDDTGRSEAESRGESEAVEEPVIAQQVVVLRSGNREEVTPRQDLHSQPTVGNVTGKGGDQADYRRRTIEYVDTNRNLYSKQDLVIGILEEGEEGVSLRKSSSSVSSPTHSTSEPVNYPSPALLPTGLSTKIHFRSSSQQTSSQEISIEDERNDRESVALSGGCFSASSSTSGSSVEARNNSTEIPLSSAPPIVVPNGSVVTEGSNNKPTGAIPKSISFDKTAERGDKEALDEDGKHKRSFFRNFKLPFKNRRGKSFRTDCTWYCSYDSGAVGDMDSVASLRLRRGLVEETRTSKIDSSEDILAKYRGKGTSNELKEKENASLREGPSCGTRRQSISSCDIFEDAKKKLRLVLSNSEIHQLLESLPMRQAWVQKENELVAYLQLQLAEAINLQDRNLVPQLYETLRCVKMLDARQCQKVFESLKEDYKSRVPYISYLVKCQQSLLSTLAHFERLLARVNNDKRVVSDYLISLCVRLFLEKRETQISAFISEFQAISLADEKSDLLESFLETLCSDMEKDPNWQCGSKDDIKKVRRAFERSLCSRVYVHAMYPNGDGDLSRDQVLREHIAKLAKVITPNHKDLRIPKIFHCEVPWMSAQAEISELAAYRSPRDKLQCILRTISTIMNLLSLACVPAADDLIPVLVYVIIMANPPSLLSTVEYLTSFYGSKMEGEEEYYWTQFCSAIEFIKTMDYVIND